MDQSSLEQIRAYIPQSTCHTVQLLPLYWQVKRYQIDLSCQTLEWHCLSAPAAWLIAEPPRWDLYLSGCPIVRTGWWPARCRWLSSAQQLIDRWHCHRCAPQPQHGQVKEVSLIQHLFYLENPSRSRTFPVLHLILRYTSGWIAPLASWTLSAYSL